jgi:hypothetical protein
MIAVERIDPIKIGDCICDMHWSNGEALVSGRFSHPQRELQQLCEEGGWRIVRAINMPGGFASQIETSVLKGRRDLDHYTYMNKYLVPVGIHESTDGWGISLYCMYSYDDVRSGLVQIDVPLDTPMDESVWW